MCVECADMLCTREITGKYTFFKYHNIHVAEGHSLILKIKEFDFLNYLQIEIYIRMRNRRQYFSKILKAACASKPCYRDKK